MSTTPEDHLFDSLCEVAAMYMVAKGINTGLEPAAESAKQAIIDSLADTADANAWSAIRDGRLGDSIRAFHQELDIFEAGIKAEQQRIRILQAGNAPLGTEPQS